MSLSQSASEDNALYQALRPCWNCVMSSAETIAVLHLIGIKLRINISLGQVVRDTLYAC